MKRMNGYTPISFIRGDCAFLFRYKSQFLEQVLSPVPIEGTPEKFKGSRSPIVLFSVLLLTLECQKEKWSQIEANSRPQSRQDSRRKAERQPRKLKKNLKSMFERIWFFSPFWKTAGNKGKINKFFPH